MAMPKRATATIRGLTVSYLTAGNDFGPPLVLLHGIGGNASQWRNQLNDLSDSYRVIAWDAPGYGESDDPSGTWSMADYGECLIDLLDQLGIGRAHILGQSWGGVLAQEIYRIHARRFASLILSDTFAGGAQSPEE